MLAGGVLVPCADTLVPLPDLGMSEAGLAVPDNRGLEQWTLASWPGGWARGAIAPALNLLLSEKQFFLSENLTQPEKSTQPGCPSVGRRNEYQQKLGRKQTHRAMQ